MTIDARPSWEHDHVFDRGGTRAERGTRAVAWITVAMMVLEIGGGWWFNSMALLADGWHMGSHALAIGLSAMAYAAARRYANDHRFAFGTWKIEVLGGFASAIFLLGVAAAMVIGSVERMLAPEPIHYPQALAVAVLGLAVNLICARILGHAHHDHDHDHDHGHGHHAHHHHGHGGGGHAHPGEHHHDLNLRSAYLHVIADAATSVLAIIALAGGWLYGWSWLDPAMGIVGAILVAIWAKGLIRDTAKVLLDREMDHPVVGDIRETVEQGSTRIVDLHVWRVGKRSYACAMTVLAREAGEDAAAIRSRLGEHKEVAHATIEVHSHASP